MLERERHCRHMREEELMAAATGNLAAVEEQLARSKQKLEQRSHEMDQKDEELKALTVKLQEGQKSDDGLGFEKLAEKIVKEIKDSGVSLGDLSVRKIGKLDEKSFQAAFAELPPEEAERDACKLYSRWEKLVNDPSTWKPFKTVVVDGDRKDEVIDENNKKLKKLKKQGKEAYNSVVDTLKERKEYNIDGKFDFLLWNSKEGRKATLEDCIDCLIAQGKELTFHKKKGTNRQ